MRFLSMFFVLMFSSLIVLAQGKISGVVSDEKTGDPIIGAVIMIKGSAKGTSTDVDGKFQMQADAGKYTLEVKYIGYQTKEVDDVVVTKGGNTNINIVINESSSTQLQEVVVRSSLKKENISALYTIQKNAATISDGISADVIKRAPDRTTGEVLKRVSGTTIQDNKFVIVRGLSDRYNNGMVDNAILPSTEPNRKAFSFDIIPANLIDNIIITKAATPDLPGDFAGGVINVLTKEIPEENFTTISIGTNYNTKSTFKPFKSGYRSSTDFLGFDDGSRKLPSNFPTTKQVQSNLTDAQNNAAIKSLNNNYTITERTALPGANVQGSLGRSYTLKNNARFGFVSAVNYLHTETIEPNMDRIFNGNNFGDNTYKYSSNLGGLVNFGYSKGGNKLVWKTMYNQIFDDYFLDRTGNNNASNSYVKYNAFDLMQKSLFKTSVEGTHQVGKKQDKLEWLLSYNRVTNDQPDQRKIQYSRYDLADPFQANINTSGKANNRLFSTLRENVYIGNVNYTHHFDFLKTNLKIGALAQYRQRSFDARFIGLVLDELSISPEEATAIKQRNSSTIYSNDLIDKGCYKLNEITLPSDAYDASSLTQSGYVMLDNKFSDKIRLVWGARAELFNIQLDSKDLLGNPLKVDDTWLDILPSANLTYSLNEKSNLRASYYKTVARPEFRELAPFAYYDYELTALSFGNQHLKRSQINNLDLRYEIYPSAGEIFSISAFYKHFQNTLESIVDAQNSQLEVSIRNYPSAQNVGVEMELRKSLRFIDNNSKVFKNLNFYANLAYIKSSVNTSYTDVSGNVIDVERPLTGQSNYVVNTSLGYTALDGKLNLNVLYNRIGPRIYLVGDPRSKDGNGLLGNIWEAPRNILDGQVSYNLNKRSDLRLSIKDMLSSQYFLYADQNGNKKFDNANIRELTSVPTGRDYIVKAFRPGTTFSLTYTYRF